MSEYRTLSAEDALAAAEAAMSRSAGFRIAITRIADLGGDQRRNIILRASAAGWPGEQSRPVIVKATRAAGYDATAADVFESSGLVKEWAATTLLEQRRLEGRGGDFPALLASDSERGVLVFGDLGEGLPLLVRPLLHGSADEAEQALLAYARSLARLHVVTAGCDKDYAGIVRSGYPSTVVAPRGRNWSGRVAGKVAEMLGGSLPDDEVEAVAERVRAAGPWLALVHGDACPDNVLLAPDGTAKLVDFEFSMPGHVLLDAAYWRMGFPTCWCAGRVPEAVADRIEKAYRSILAEAVPLAADDAAFARESALIGMAWLFGNLAWLLEGALREDRTWGISSVRGRILHYFEFAIGRAAEADILPGLRDAASGWLDRLRSQWPDSAPLALYPALKEPAGPAG